MEPASEAPGAFRAKSFLLDQAPKPSFALGLRRGLGGTSSQSTTEPPFSAFWQEHRKIHGAALRMLEQHPITKLHPRPAMQGNLVYPCFMHEIGSKFRSEGGAVNSLARSFAFALDQQEELRLLAGAPVGERMPVFGVVSSSHRVAVWYAAYVGSDIVSLDPVAHVSCYRLLLSTTALPATVRRQLTNAFDLGAAIQRVRIRRLYRCSALLDSVDVCTPNRRVARSPVDQDDGNGMKNKEGSECMIHSIYRLPSNDHVSIICGMAPGIGYQERLL